MTAKWRYGDSWEKFPIEDGDIWCEENTESQVAACDLFDGIPDFMMLADMIYVDPPWNTGNINSFYTKAGINARKSFEEFSAMLFDRIDTIRPKVCYVEIGRQNKNTIVERLDWSYSSVQAWRITYYKKNPSFMVRGADAPIDFDFTGYDDMDTPTLAMMNEDFECVGDLCMGRGLTGISAYRLGKHFVGTELNKRRLAVLIDKTTRMGARWSK